MLFWREFKKTVAGIPYILFVAVIVVALNSQGVLDFQNEVVTEPVQDASQNYETKTAEIPEVIMPAALEALYAEFLENKYQTYPIGFVKYVKLDENNQRKIAQILSEISGVNAAALPDENNIQNEPDLSVRKDISSA